MASSIGENIVSWLKKVSHVNKPLLTTKALVFLYYGGNFALNSYMSLHMKSIGISLAQMTFLSTVLAWTSLFGGPIVGALADKTGRYRLILSICLILAILLHTLLLLAVPVYKVNRLVVSMDVSDLQADFVCTGSSFPARFFPSQSMNCSSGWTPDPSNATLTNSTWMEFTECWTNCTDPFIEPSITLSGQNLSTSVTYLSLPGETFWNVALKNISDGLDGFPMWNLGRFSHSNVRFSSMFCGVNAEADLNCSVQCLVQSNLMVPCILDIPEGDQALTYGLYFAIRLVTGFVMNVCFCMVDSTMIYMTQEYSGDLGINRAFIQVGMMAIPPLSGLFIDFVSGEEGSANFSPAFYIFDGMMLLTLCLLLFSKMQVRTPARHVWKSVGTLVFRKNPKMIGFLFVIFFIGLCIGFLESFLFWFLDDMKAPKWLLGLTSTVAGLAAIPVVASATFFVRHFGHTKLLVLAVITYGFRFLGYSFTYDPYWILPIEMLEAFSNGLMWTTVQLYAVVLAPEYVATLQGIAMGIHAGLGIGLGSMLGGVMIGSLGYRMAFRVFSFVCFGFGLGYLLFHWTCTRRCKAKDTISISTENEKLA